jgi:hypothetical protein
MVGTGQPVRVRTPLRRRGALTQLGSLHPVFFFDNAATRLYYRRALLQSD